MPFADISENHLVNVADIDNQHKDIFILINELYDLSEKNKSADHLLIVIQEILSKSIHHFTTEESLMQKYNFLNYYSHKIEHDRFIRKIKEFIENDEAEDKLLKPDFLLFLRNWLTGHIETKDKNLGIFLSENGVK